LYETARIAIALALAAHMEGNTTASSAEAFDRVQQRDEHGWTMLHWAARYGVVVGDPP